MSLFTAHLESATITGLSRADGLRAALQAAGALEVGQLVVGPRGRLALHITFQAEDGDESRRAHEIIRAVPDAWSLLSIGPVARWLDG